MKNWLPYLTIILLIVILILQEKTNRLEKEKHLRQQNDLKIRLDSIQRELGRTLLVRDSLYNVNTTLHIHSQTLKSELDKANDKLKNIPGSYDKLTNKELESKMIERWKRGR